MESPSHSTLKRLALDFLLSQGCAAAATEVACPISRYRIDAAGYVDPLPKHARIPALADIAFPRRRQPTSVLIECKVSRADFLRDQRNLPALLSRREHLQRALDRLRDEIVKPMEPHLRRSDGFLFAEMETWDFSGSRLHSHRAILRALRRIDRKLYEETKFFMIAQYRLGAQLFIFAPRNMIHPRELPAGWGLLEADQALAGVQVRVAVPPQASPERFVQRTLRNIAVAASRDHRRAVVRRSLVPGRDALSAAPAAAVPQATVSAQPAPSPRS